MNRPPLGRRLVAEAFGTYVLVCGATGAAVVGARLPGSVGSGTGAAAAGLAVVAIILAIGHLSGAHINPAVTLAFAVGRHFPAREVAPYVAVQCVGAVLASLSLRAIFGVAGGLGATHPAGVSTASAVAIEVVLTLVLVVVVLAVATDTRALGEFAAVAVGATVALEALVMGPVTGASMNPARSLGPALAGLDGADLWIYIVAPLAGALAGVGAYAVLRGAPPTTIEETP